MRALAASWLGTSQMEMGEAFILCSIIVGMVFIIMFLSIQFNLLVHQLI